MTSFLWPNEDGWPYPDEESEIPDPNGDIDIDVISVEGLPERLLDGLDPLERLVVAARFGVGGHVLESMKELHRETGLQRAELRLALGSGLAKLRLQLA
ncbi:MAG: hypothetical protein ACRD1G_07820 [Acidimicrobiales bacterium]